MVIQGAGHWQLIENGANCTIATNNVLNPFTPYGDCSLTRIVNLYANVVQLKLDGLIEFPPVTAEGVGYVTTARGTVTAFDTQTGSVVWRRPLDERMGASPGVADGRVFVVSFEGQIRALVTVAGNPVDLRHGVQSPARPT